MATTQVSIKTKKSDELDFRAKAAILDELLELIEEKLFGYLTKASEKEKNIPLSKARKFLS